MSFAERALEFTFTLANDAKGGQRNFTGTQNNTLSVSGLRAKARILKAGGQSLGQAQVEVYGITLSQMNDLSTLGMQVQTLPRNTVSIKAGNLNEQLSEVFVGAIYNAYVDLNQAPDGCFRLNAQTAAVDGVTITDPNSYSGSVDVAGVLQMLAGKMGLTFENSGVDGKIKSPYLWGSPRTQAEQIVQHAGIGYVIDDKTLAIWPKNKGRNGDTLVISVETGMKGYPSFTAQGISVSSEFTKDIKFGGKFQVKSILLAASKTWVCYRLDHDLSCFYPRGPWFTNLLGYNPDFAPPVTT